MITETSVQNTSGKRVCIIGAGIAGLVTAKVFQADGFAVTLFEKQAELGGVWAASRTYPGLRANNPRETYAFSDYPYPATADEYPTAEQVRSYLNAYADHFGIRPLIRLATEVVAVASDAAGFEVIVQPTNGNAGAERIHFDFVVICNGVFSEPQIPHIEGQVQFAGPILHSSQVTDPAIVAGRRVVVVGAGKSALDCATWAANHQAQCTLVFRTAHWMAPRYFGGRIRADRIFMTRATETLLRYHHLQGVEAFLHGPAKVWVRGWWRIQSEFLRRSLQIPAILTPETPLPAGFENIGIGGEFYAALQRGNLQLKRARIARCVDATTLELDTGEKVAADVIILATGWRQGLPFLSEELRQAIESNGYLRLYRHILPPRLPNLGFIGYASSTACQLTAEIGAHWLAQWFRGELALGTVDEMEQEIDRVLQWAAEIFPVRSQGYFIGPYVAHYLDDLLRDMGLPCRRTRHFWTEYFAPYWPDRYRDVSVERRQSGRY
ncbi:MAG: NAD(P)/FAD-dependent oxidoreductase [Caldilineaceae bacterium]